MSEKQGLVTGSPKGNNPSILISALLSGHQLVKMHEIGEKEILWCETGNDGRRYFYMCGWGSAFGDARDRVFDVIDNPEQWAIELPNLEASDTTDDAQRTEPRQTK